jgi:alpha/beta hydrolase fold
MIPNAVSMQSRYGSLKNPVVIIAGDQDRLVNIDQQSARLHHAMGQSKLRRVAGAGHMVHQTAPALVMAALEEALTESGELASEGGPHAASPRAKGSAPPLPRHVGQRRMVVGASSISGPRIASGSNLTFESWKGFPSGSLHASLAHGEPEFPLLSSLLIAAV